MILYLDSSSTIKLYLLQANVVELGAETVRQHVEGAEAIATSRITYAETRAGLARARREGRITEEEEYREIVRAFDRDWPSYIVAPVSNRVVRVAGDLAERHALRGYDAVHLASALELTRRIPTAFHFSSYDDDLKDAAQAEGLAIS